MAGTTSRSRHWAQRTDARTALRTALVWENLDPCVADLAAERGPLRIVDLGGGTGGFAVPLAVLGHHVTVVDPSPDALASLRRRAAESGVDARVQAVQGDAGELADRLGVGVADVLLCHGALEYADDPAAALADALAVLTPGGLLSLLVEQRLGAVLARAMAGRFAAATDLLEHPAGDARADDQRPRRLDEAQVRSWLTAAGAQVRLVHGVRMVSDLLPGALVDAEPGGVQALLDLERRLCARPEFAALAAQLHVVAVAGDTAPA